MKTILHIGNIKTGTSSIQQVFAKNRKELAKQATLYPQTPGEHVHLLLPAFFQKGPKGKRLFQQFAATNKNYSDFNDFLKRFSSDLTEEIEQVSPDKLILSSEHLSQIFTDENAGEIVRSIIRYFEIFSNDIEVVFYAREQASLVASHYSTVIKNGSTSETLEAFWAKNKHLYDYEAMLKPWLNALPKGAMKFRIYSRENLYGGDILADFSHLTGVDTQDFSMVGSNANRSLSHEMMMLMRHVNRFLPDFLDDQLNPVRVGTNALFERCDCGTRKFSPPRGLSKQIREEYAKSNQRLFNQLQHAGFPAEKNNEDDIKDDQIDPDVAGQMLALMICDLRLKNASPEQAQKIKQFMNKANLGFKQ